MKNKIQKNKRDEKMKNIPQRTCIGCNQKKDKEELIRIVKKSNNDIFIDKEGKEDGRGAYVCNNAECVNKLMKNKRLEKNFKIEISSEVYENLRGVILGK